MNLYKTGTANRADIVRAKHIYGFWFGATLGFTFAIFAWGIDAYWLSRINSLYPWIKFATGTLACVLMGGFTGWLSARLDKPIIAAILWAGTASLFAWLTVALPMRITPTLLNSLEPDLQGLLHYPIYENFATRIGISFTWLAVFVTIAGLLQIPLSDTAVFSTSLVGKISPMLVCLVLMIICGTIIDDLNNKPFRTPIDLLNTSIQFFVDHQGQKIDPAESRLMHLGSLRAIQDVITPGRKFIVSGYDEYLGEVNVLVHFQRAWVECAVSYGQSFFCERIGSATE